MRVSADFGRPSDAPQNCVVVAREVDFEATQDIDVDLPSNFLWKVEKVETVVRTAPSAIKTHPRLGVSSVRGGEATVVLGDADLVAETENAVDAHAGSPPAAAASAESNKKEKAPAGARAEAKASKAADAAAASESAATPVIVGGDAIRLVVTAGKVTGPDIRDVLVYLTRW